MTAAARAAIALALAIGALGCEGKRPAPDADAATGRVDLSRSTHTVAPEPSASPSAPSADAAARDDSGMAVTSAPGDEAGESSATADTAGDGGALVGEERERDPRSDTVKIKVIVDARRQAHVTWGRKDFGVAPLEIERPRNSGPLDLIVTAPGCLPLHARALTDRDDVLTLRLYSPAEAPQLLGYRPEPAPPTETGSPGSPNLLQNKGEKRAEAKVTGAARGGRAKTGGEKNPTTKPPRQSR